MADIIHPSNPLGKRMDGYSPESVDLAGVVGADISLSRHGRYLRGLCPFHGESTPSLVVFPERGNWHCFGCGKHGTAADWLMEQRGLTFKEAIAELGFQTSADYSASEKKRKLEMPKASEPPCLVWRKRAEQFVRECEQSLWSTSAVLDYLRGPKRGLTDDTIKRARLGFNPEDRWVDAADFGLEGNRVFLPKGVTIPCWAGDTLWYVKIRRGKGADNKYGMIYGGTTALFGSETIRSEKAVCWWEGEFDCLVAQQEAGDLCGHVTYGSASGLPSGFWAAAFLGVRRVHVCLDRDKAGEQGSNRLVRWFGERATVERISIGKDLTEMKASGWDVRRWIDRRVTAVADREVSI